MIIERPNRNITEEIFEYMQRIKKENNSPKETVEDKLMKLGPNDLIIEWDGFNIVAIYHVWNIVKEDIYLIDQLKNIQTILPKEEIIKKIECGDILIYKGYRWQTKKDQTD